MLKVAEMTTKRNQMNEIRAVESSPEKARVDGSIPSLATILSNQLQRLLPENLGAIGCKKFRLAGKVASQFFPALMVPLGRLSPWPNPKADNVNDIEEKQRQKRRSHHVFQKNPAYGRSYSTGGGSCSWKRRPLSAPSLLSWL